LKSAALSLPIAWHFASERRIDLARFSYHLVL
jgi:hypothetical protein